MASRDDPRLELLDERDRTYVEEFDEDEREVVVSTLTRYRRPDRLHEGDDLPPLAALSLEDGSGVELRDLVRERPLLLVFGSFT
jgi:hypothetical protein